MSLDARGREAAETLYDGVADDLPAAEMLASIRRTRTRRRLALVAPAVALMVAVGAALTIAPRHDESAPVGPPPVPHANGALFGVGSRTWRAPVGLVVPPIGFGSSPTWSPDGSQVATLTGGILVTDVRSGQTHRLPCVSCTEIAWSPDGRTFAAAGSGGAPLELVDAGTGDVTDVPLAGVQSLSSVTWAPGSDRLAFRVSTPVRLEGAYTVDRDGSHLVRFAPYPTYFSEDSRGLPVVLAVRWAPTGDRIAVLRATPRTPQAGRTGPYELAVVTYHSDGSGPDVLLRAGSCACVGFVPNIVWSPDGGTLGMSSLEPSATVTRVEGDGDTVRIRFLVGADGPLTWQPLPVDP